MEPPTVRDATLSLANRDPFADTLEVFKSHPATGAFGLRDQPPADGVVHVPGEPPLLPSAFLEKPEGRLRPLCRLPRPC